MPSSGLTAISTTSDSAVDLINDSTANNTAGRVLYVIN